MSASVNSLPPTLRVIKKNSGMACRLDNEATLDLLARVALSQVEAGADMVAPSAMADGQVQAIRGILDDNDYSEVPVMLTARNTLPLFTPVQGRRGIRSEIRKPQILQMDLANSGKLCGK